MRLGMYERHSAPAPAPWHDGTGGKGRTEEEVESMPDDIPNQFPPGLGVSESEGGAVL
jgi:hypothetical protein